MYKIIIVLFLFLFAANNKLHAQKADIVLYQQSLSPSVHILVGTDKRITGSGSGVVVKSIRTSRNVYLNTAITCDHVVALNTKSFLEIAYYEKFVFAKRSNHSFPYITYARYPSLDLAVIVFLTPFPLPTAKINFSPKLYIGNDVYGVGYKDTPRFIPGKITDTSINNKRYRTSMYVVKGDSGGGVYNTDYELVGVISSILFDYNSMASFNGISYFTPMSGLLNKKDIKLDFIYKNEGIVLELWTKFLKLDYSIYEHELHLKESYWE